jgi:hypothetical protein
MEQTERVYFPNEPDYQEMEPDCTCVQIGVDLSDASDCDFHNPASDWNKSRRAAVRIDMSRVTRTEFEATAKELRER